MRPIHILLLVAITLLAVDSFLLYGNSRRRARREENRIIFDITTSGLGLTDLCIATEARYTRHPAVSDMASAFMDHPGALEHFPSGTFWAVPPFPGNTASRKP